MAEKSEHGEARGFWSREHCRFAVDHDGLPRRHRLARFPDAVIGLQICMAIGMLIAAGLGTLLGSRSPD
jgi:hypothetical protein